ncbi:hypothetical protein GCM10029964_119250 [Kibdelosporangium lantanae]
MCDAWKRHSRAVFPVGLVLLAAAELVVSATVTDDEVRIGLTVGGGLGWFFAVWRIALGRRLVSLELTTDGVLRLSTGESVRVVEPVFGRLLVVGSTPWVYLDVGGMRISSPGRSADGYPLWARDVRRAEVELSAEDFDELVGLLDVPTATGAKGPVAYLNPGLFRLPQLLWAAVCVGIVAILAPVNTAVPETLRTVASVAVILLVGLGYAGVRVAVKLRHCARELHLDDGCVTLYALDGEVMTRAPWSAVSVEARIRRLWGKRRVYAFPVLLVDIGGYRITVHNPCTVPGCQPGWLGRRSCSSGTTSARGAGTCCSTRSTGGTPGPSSVGA